MTPTTGRTAPSAGRELVITRTLNAPRELVWRAWTDPRHMRQWWGPVGFDTPVCEIDLREGGTWFFCMRSADGPVIWCTGVYREIAPPERLVFTDCFADEHGNVVPATTYGMPADIPLEMLVTVTLEEQDGRTLMTMRHQGLPSSMTADAGSGWGSSFDKLEEELAKMSS